MPPDPPPAAERRRPRARAAGLVVLLALPLALRLLPIGHGLPENHLPDTHVVRGALGMAADRDLTPPVGRWSTYPNLLPYSLLPVYAAQYALGLAAGEWGGAAEFGELLKEEPWLAHLPARVLVALLGALTVWVVLRGARAAGLGAGAWIAAWLVATGLLHVHFSVQERPWVPMVLFLALAAWPAARHAREGRARDLVLSGVAAGLAFATHQGGLAALGLSGLAWLLAPRGWRGRELGRRIGTGAAAVLVFAVVALAVGYPAYLVHGTEHAAVAGEELQGQGDLEIGGQQIAFSVSARSFTRLSRALLGYDPAVLLLGLAGVVRALRLRGARPVVLFALLWGAFFLTNRNDHVRYLLPLAVLLAWPAGAAGELLLARAWGRVLLVPLLALPLVQATRLGAVLRRDDTRALAAALLAELPADARVAVDVHGPPLPLAEGALHRVAEWRALGAREAHRLALYEAGHPPPAPGFDAIPLEDLLGYERRDRSSWLKPGRESLGATPDEVLAALGATHVLLVDLDTSDGRPPLLADPAQPPAGREKLPPLSLAPEPEWVVDPCRARDGCEARLPTELSFALTAIWRAERPGPWLALYRLE